MALQLSCAVLLRNTAIFSWPFFLTAYVIGATANQNIFLSIHEISHNLAFRSPLANRLFAVFANLPIGVPYSAAFRVRIHPVIIMKSSYELTTCPALSSYPSQVSRCRRSRYGPTHILRSLLSRLCPRQSLFLHLPDSLLCTTADDGISTTHYSDSPL